MLVGMDLDVLRLDESALGGMRRYDPVTDLVFEEEAQAPPAISPNGPPQEESDYGTVVRSGGCDRSGHSCLGRSDPCRGRAAGCSSAQACRTSADPAYEEFPVIAAASAAPAVQSLARQLPPPGQVQAKAQPPQAPPQKAHPSPKPSRNKGRR